MKLTRPQINIHNHYFQLFILIFIFTIFSVSACIRLSIFSGFSPVECSSSDDMDSHYDAGDKYLKISAEKLYYTGYDYLVRNSVRGHYYYSLENEKCTIYLISCDYLNNAGKPPLTLENISLNAALKKNDPYLKPLLEYMAADLNWNYSGLSAHTGTVVVSEYHYSLPLYITIALTAIFGIIATVISAVYIVIKSKPSKTTDKKSAHNKSCGVR